METHVIFGTGAAGAAVMRALVKRGKSVRMINRSGKPSQATGSTLPANVEIRSGDAYDAAQVRALTSDAAAVYQCSQPEYTEWATKFPPLQAAIIEGVSATSARLIVLENLYMYGDPAGKPLSESSPLNPNSGKGRVRLAMSESLMAAHRSGKIRAAAARASDYYGPGYTLNGDQIFYPVLAGKTARGLGSLDALHTFTHTLDVGEAMATLAEHDEALGQVWHVPSAPAITQRHLITQAFQIAGTTPKLGAINSLMMRLAGLFIPGAREVAEMMYEFERPFIVDSSKFSRAFGMTATPYAEGLAATLSWFRANPKAAK
ncbi:MAG: NAD-dependent epimerase/dehydratase family protein [Chloroflexota bacterium]